MNDISKEFIERMGLLIERDGGFSRIAGRMLGFFLLDGTPRTLDEMAEMLQISKASASTNARILEQIGLLERFRTYGDRRDYYRIGDSPWENLFDVARRRNEAVLSLIEETANDLPTEMRESRERLEEWRDFYRFILEGQAEYAARWHRKVSEKRALEGPGR